MEDYSQNQETDISYPRSVRIGVFLISFLALTVVGWQMQSRIRLALPTLANGTSKISDALSILEQEDDLLRDQDSDQDGLSDYEELRVYGTSPFFADSDSDGESDRDEILALTDPNCPIGQDCSTPITIADLGEIEGGQSNVNFDPGITPLLSDPAELRRILIKSGLDPEIVNNTDDQTIQIIAQEAFGIYQQESQQQNLDLVSSLSPDAIRQLLVSSGSTQSEVDGLTDEDISLIIQQLQTDLGSFDEVLE